MPLMKQLNFFLNGQEKIMTEAEIQEFYVGGKRCITKDLRSLRSINEAFCHYNGYECIGTMIKRPINANDV